MIPALSNQPIFGRNGNAAEKIAYAVMSADCRSTYTSVDGRKFRPRRVLGDLRWYAERGTIQVSINCPVGHHDGLWLIPVGWIPTGGGNAQSRALLFATRDWRHFYRVPTPLEGPANNRRYIGAAWGAGYWVAVTTDGQTTYSLDGMTGWTVGPSLGITATCIAGSNDAICIGGQNAAMRTTNQPNVSYTARSLGASWSGTVIAIEAGNVFLISGQAGRLATAPLNNPATWTFRTSGYSSTVGIPKLIRIPTRWFAAGLEIEGNRWAVSSDGTSWALVTAPGDNYARFNLSFWNGERLTVHSSTNQMFESDDNGTTWTEILDHGLPSGSLYVHGYRDAA